MCLAAVVKKNSCNGQQTACSAATTTTLMKQQHAAAVTSSNSTLDMGANWQVTMLAEAFALKFTKMMSSVDCISLL